MARQPRYVLPGHPQHVIQRGHNRSAIFARDEDYSFYLHCLAEASNRYACDVHAYVLMPNHVHLLATPRRANSISKVLQSVGGRYAQYVNSTYRRSGSLWEGRYRSTVLDPEEYLLPCMAYIELNPVRAGLVARPEDYRWSSYHRNAAGRPDMLVRTHEVYEQLGSTVRAQQEEYRALLATPLDERVLADIRNMTNKGWVLGGARFRERLEGVLNRRMVPLPRGGDRRSGRIRAAGTPFAAMSDPFVCAAGEPRARYEDV